MRDRISVIQRAGSYAANPSLAPGCEIGPKIPAGFTGKSGITLGRPAKPGERYWDIAPSGWGGS